MRSIVAALAVGLAGCVACSSTPVAQTVDPRTSAERAEAKSVAVTEDGHAACGGVWVSRTQFVTSMHCVKPDEDEAGPVSEADAVLEALGLEPPKPAIVGRVIGYQTKDGSSFTAVVSNVDEDVDLALLSTSQPPEHDIARVSRRDLHDGEELDVVGSTAGLAFTYSRCYVAATRKEYLQVSGPVFLGNSGGGAFDERGDLVGIANHMIGVGGEIVPTLSFFTPASTLRRFLDGAS